jgi:hypothetical protein
LYTLKTYWLCFLIVVIVSIIGLVIFSIASKRVGGRTTYKSLTGNFWDRVQGNRAKKL